jgi:hypothetical protein
MPPISSSFTPRFTTQTNVVEMPASFEVGKRVFAHPAQIGSPQILQCVAS